MNYDATVDMFTFVVRKKITLNIIMANTKDYNCSKH